MERTIFAGDRIMADQRAYLNRLPARGDVIAFRHNQFYLVKRVIGLPGDRIASRYGKISVNGAVLDEPYANHDSDEDTDYNDFSEVVVPPGELYLLGDNRNASLDSRMQEFGQVFTTDVAGKVLYIYGSRNDQTGARVR
jgi:signal peptidase I